MSVTLAGWLLAFVSLAISALLLLRPDARERRRLPHLDAGRLIVPAAVFLFVAGFGAATSYLWEPGAATGSGDANARAQPAPGPDDELLESLAHYSRSIAAEEPEPAAAAGELLPDVSTMIGRLATRLETTPDDIDGWRMLGWSYFNTGRYAEAATAYAKAVALDPGSADLRLAFDTAKAKAADHADAKVSSSLQPEAIGDSGDGASVEKIAVSEAMPARERDASIRSMVDGLAARLQRSPRNVDGWTRLMRSRVVLGQRDVAATTMRTALDVFKDDAAASRRITAAAIELGLSAE